MISAPGDPDALLPSQSRNWLTERVGYLPQVCRICAKSRPRSRPAGRYRGIRNGLTIAALTMIKIVLIESISFAPPSQ
jgi:hypothetical protein